MSENLLQLYVNVYKQTAVMIIQVIQI